MENFLGTNYNLTVTDQNGHIINYLAIRKTFQLRKK